MAPPKRPLAERLWPRVEKTETCWIWRGHVSTSGYGGISVDGTWHTIKRVHRVVYELLVGPIPDGLQIDHLCRVRACVNPLHLEPVTPKVNVHRGLTITAANKNKTHCKNGHPFTHVNGQGRRVCRMCMNEWANEYRAKRRAAGLNSHGQPYKRPPGVEIVRAERLEIR